MTFMGTAATHSSQFNYRSIKRKVFSLCVGVGTATTYGKVSFPNRMCRKHIELVLVCSSITAFAAGFWGMHVREKNQKKIINTTHSLPPLNNTTTSFPPFNNTTPSLPPFNNTTPSLPPFNNTTPSLHPSITSPLPSHPSITPPLPSHPPITPPPNNTTPSLPPFNNITPSLHPFPPTPQ